jgi:hypothetical protein
MSFEATRRAMPKFYGFVDSCTSAQAPEIMGDFVMTIPITEHPLLVSLCVRRA